MFLDEFGELPPDVQPKLLRALAEKRIKPLGGNRYLEADVRIIAATRCDLAATINDGAFRCDLFFRVAQVRIDLPALRERREDIPGLIAHMLAELGEPEALGRISTTTLERVTRYDWPGNVRELKNAVAAALAMTPANQPLDIAAHIGLLGAPMTLTALPSARTPFRQASRSCSISSSGLTSPTWPKKSADNVSEMACRAGIDRVHEEVLAAFWFGTTQTQLEPVAEGKNQRLTTEARRTRSELLFVR